VRHESAGAVVANNYARINMRFQCDLTMLGAGDSQRTVGGQGCRLGQCAGMTPERWWQRLP
jgi:hypothetical protein